jgi:hypothetical protein
MALDENPVIFTQDNDAVTHPCRIVGVIWFGATTATDTVDIVSRVSGDLKWQGYATGTQTYAVCTALNVPCPEGIKAASWVAGTTALVYLGEL